MPKLSPAAVQKYTALPHRREIRDTQAPGLYLIIQPKPSGAKSWAMRFRRHGKSAKLTLGSVDLSDKEAADEPTLGGALTLRQARELANRIDRERARGIDVIAEYQAHQRRQAAAALSEAADSMEAANSFARLLHEFFVDHKTRRWQQRPRHWREDARLLGLNYPKGCDPAEIEKIIEKIIPGSLAATWADRPVARIDQHDVYTAIDEARRLGIPGLEARTKGTSEARGRKMHAALSVFFSWALSHRKVTTDPTLGVWHPGPPPPRDRILSTDELRWFWRACEQIGQPYGSLFQVLLLTAQRLDEVTGMSRDELNDGSSWVIPTERSKNHRAHLVPLSAMARGIIASLPRVESAGGFVFTVTGKKLSGFSKAKATLDAAMAEIARAEGRELKKPWTLHDLRRSSDTGMNDEIGVLPHIVEAVLNHVSGHKAGIAGIYNLAQYAAEKKAALEAWARFLALVVDAELYAAHQKFIAANDVRHKEAFKEKIAEGGDAWSRYLKLITADASGKVISLARRKSK